MIIPPLEQSNISSVYDFSPSQFSGFETIYAKLLFLVWNTFSNYPVCVYFSIRSFSSNYLPLSWAATSSISAPYAAALGACLPFVYFLSTLTYKFLATTGLAGLFTIIDPVYYVYHSFPSSFWCTLWANFNLLYSPDHLFSSKVFDLLPVSDSSSTKLAAGSGSVTGPWPLLDANLSLACGGSATLSANVYFLLMEVGLSVWSTLSAATIEKALALNTKDLSHLIFPSNTSTIRLTFGFLFFTFLFTSTLVSVTLVSRNRWQTLLEISYDPTPNVVADNAGPKGRPSSPLISTTSTIIPIRNVQGMIPYSSTVTSHSIVTLSPAPAIPIGTNIIGVFKNGRHFPSLFFPPGAPLPLAPLPVSIELVPYVLRVSSSSIRLFANLMSGHTLPKILSGSAWAAVSARGSFSIPPVTISSVTGLESAIAFLQAYILSVPPRTYINDAFNSHQLRWPPGHQGHRALRPILTPPSRGRDSIGGVF